MRWPFARSEKSEPAAAGRAVVRPRLAAVPRYAKNPLPASGSEPAGKPAANDQVAPESELPAQLERLPFAQEIVQTPELYEISWDAIAGDGKHRADVEWLRSNAVVLQRHAEIGVILCYVDSARNAVLLQSLRNSVQLTRREILAEHVVSADTLNNIYERLDRRNKVRIESGVVAKDAATIYNTLTNEIVSQAVALDASDIHFRVRTAGGENKGQVLMRVDGELEVVKQLDPTTLHQVIAALYAKSDQHSLAQGQGQFNDSKPHGSFIRLSSVEKTPELRFQSNKERYGFDAVVRVLNYEGKVAQQLSLAALGFLPSQVQLIEEASFGPGGSVLTVGETGSGKTTTVNAIIASDPGIQGDRRYAMSVEDPPEGRPPRLSQFPVARSAEADDSGKESPFIGVLRAMMRMDGDVISLGEIRDAKSAEIWLELALTGHKCFATIHAPSPVGAIARLCSNMMRLTPETVSGEDAISAVIFQKRIPRLCQNPDCMLRAVDHWQGDMATRKLKAVEGMDVDPASLFVRNMNGCPSCRQGKKGSLVLAEIFNPDVEMRRLLGRREFREAEYAWRETRGQTPFTSEEVQGKTAFEVGLYFASKGLIGIDTLDHEVKRVLSHSVVGRSH